MSILISKTLLGFLKYMRACMYNYFLIVLINYFPIKTFDVVIHLMQQNQCTRLKRFSIQLSDCDVILRADCLIQFFDTDFPKHDFILKLGLVLTVSKIVFPSSLLFYNVLCKIYF